LSIGAGSEFARVAGRATLEFQPDLFARRNVAFFVNGDVGDRSTDSITTGVRFYFGPDKSLIRRHREDDPDWQLPFFDPAFTGGVGASSSEDIVAGQGPGGGPRVVVWDGPA
jgi:hypothetical protein